jgi:hypothetical protein
VKVIVVGLLVLALAAPVTAQARLDVLPETGARIELRYEPGLANTARELRDAASAELAQIHADLTDLPVADRITIQLVRDASSLASVAPPGRGAPIWAVGVAYPDLGTVSIALRRGGQIVDARATLRHELAHLALGAAFGRSGDRIPHWLHEGFAYQHSGEWSWDRTETLAGMAWFGGIVPLGELDHSFPAEELPANRAYAESYDFVGYLSRRGRFEDASDEGDRWPFRRFLSEVGHGAELDAAARHAFGKPLRALFDEWAGSLAKRYMLAPVGLLGLAVWVLCALLLALAWLRRRRHNRRRLAQWEAEDRMSDQQRARPVVVPPYVPWPGEDPLEDDDDDRPVDPRQVN